MNMQPEDLKKQISGLVKQYYDCVHKNKFEKKFEPGKDAVNYAGRIYDEKEITAAVDDMLDFWLTFGSKGKKFEKEFANYLGAKHSIMVNSGSSANLLAITALTSPALEKRLIPGDEVITVAAAFPTTVAPILQNNLVPVYLDVKLGTYNMDVSRLKDALSKKTKAIFAAHTLGNPFDLDTVMSFAKEHDLYVVEDNCDALGAKWNGKLTGTYGIMGTASFFPAHHITAGEGGAVFTNNSQFCRILKSLRSWGRDCWCEPGASNTCGKRFEWKFEGLPEGYDHKNIYTHIGYNLKPLDVQAVILSEQLKKLPVFIEARKNNFNKLDAIFRNYEDKFILPEKLPNADPSWFGYVVTLKKDAGFTKEEIVRCFENAKIETRPLFAGNIINQPAYRNAPCRIVGGLENTDYVMNNTFWLGVYPGLNKEKIEYVKKVLDKFMENK